MLPGQQPRLAQSRERTAVLNNRMPVAVVGLVLASLLVAVFFGTAITRSISKPLAATVTQLRPWGGRRLQGSGRRASGARRRTGRHGARGP